MKHIYIDLWGHSLITSASSSWLFILLMDKTSFFQTVEFLREKSAENTLGVLKTISFINSDFTNDKNTWKSTERQDMSSI